MARLEHQHPVAGRKSVDERCLPRAGSGAWIDDDGRCGQEGVLQPGQHLFGERSELRPSVIDRRLAERAQHSVGNIRGSWNLEKMSPALGHGKSLGGVGADLVEADLKVRLYDHRTS